jgi:hypothetical protein
MNPTTEPQTNTVPQTPPPSVAKLQAIVDYLSGISIVGAESALLEWTADDRIRFFKMNFETNQATEVLFDVPVGQIENVGGTMAMLTFTVAGKKYNAQFSQTAAAKMGVGGMVGLGMAYADTKQSGIGEWTTLFTQHGVKSTVKGWGWSMKVAFIIVGFILFFTIIYSVITVSMNR